MERNIKGKIVAVTGGASGIGYDIADKFLQHGAEVVVLLDFNESQGSQCASKLKSQYGIDRCVFLKCDVTKDLESVTKAILNMYRTVDVLVNSAGIMDEKNPKKVIELNVIAVVEWSLKFVEHMRKDRGGKGGTIINVSSIYGFMIDQYLPVYKASKYAVMGFTKTKGHKYNYDKTAVRLLVLCPGITKTNMVNNYEEWDENNKDFKEYFDSLPHQEVDAVGKAAVELFEKADSGTAWLIQEGSPITEV